MHLTAAAMPMHHHSSALHCPQPTLRPSSGNLSACYCMLVTVCSGAQSLLLYCTMGSNLKAWNPRAGQLCAWLQQCVNDMTGAASCRPLSFRLVWAPHVSSLHVSPADRYRVCQTQRLLSQALHDSLQWQCRDSEQTEARPQQWCINALSACLRRTLVVPY